MSAVILSFDHPERTERAFWARRRFGPLAFAEFMKRYGVTCSDPDALRSLCNAALDDIERDEGELAALRAISAGDERIAALVIGIAATRRAAS